MHAPYRLPQIKWTPAEKVAAFAVMFACFQPLRKTQRSTNPSLTVAVVEDIYHSVR